MLNTADVAGTFIIGGFGWFTTWFIGEPILALRQLRAQIQEELIYTSNLATITGDGSLDGSEIEKYRQTCEKFRRLAAQINALHVRWPIYFKWWLRLPLVSTDLQLAQDGLIGLSNAHNRRYMIEFRDKIQRALHLTRCYSDKELKNIYETFEKRAQANNRT